MNAGEKKTKKWKTGRKKFIWQHTQWAKESEKLMFK